MGRSPIKPGAERSFRSLPSTRPAPCEAYASDRKAGSYGRHPLPAAG